MRQLTYLGKRQLQWRDVPEPGLESDTAALVRPLAVARCDLDRAIFTVGYRNPGPFAFGHEIAGEVVAVADGVRDFVPGDRVIVPFQISCGSCPNCQRGWTNACASVPPFAAYGLGTGGDLDFGGGFSDLVRVPWADAMLVKVPPALSLAAACGLSDNVADGYRTVAPLLQQFPGAEVLVVGGLARSVGLYAVHAAIALGAGRVRFTHRDTHDLALAAAAGAETERVDYGEQRAEGTPFLITVDASATAAGLAYALRSTAACGFCTGVSASDPPGDGSQPAMPLNRMYMYGVTYQVARVHGRSMLPQVLEHACCGTIDPLAVAAPTVDFEDAIDAMDDPAVKLIFTRQP